MPNIGSVLKQEISRLARREINGRVRTTKKASVQYRHDIATLKRQVAALERALASLHRRPLRESTIVTNGSGESKVRFVAKGLRAQRKRLALSAAEYGRLVGVSAQSVYNWEQEHARPRAGQLAAIAAIRSLGKRDARLRLEQLVKSDARRPRKS
jgi:DNA-binding XRE family transcriptional regulator